MTTYSNNTKPPSSSPGVFTVGGTFTRSTSNSYSIPAAGSPQQSGVPAPSGSFTTFTLPNVRRVFPSLSTTNWSQPQKYAVAEKPSFVLEKGRLYVMEIHSPMDTFLNFTYTYGTGATTSTVNATVPPPGPSPKEKKDFSKYDKYLVISDPISPAGEVESHPFENSENSDKPLAGLSYTITMARHHNWTQKVYNLKTRQEIQVNLNPETWMSGLTERWHLVTEDGEVSEDYVSHEEPTATIQEEQMEPDPGLTKALKTAAHAASRLTGYSTYAGTSTSNNLSFFPPMILEEKPKKRKKKVAKKKKKAATKKSAKKVSGKTRSAKKVSKKVRRS